MQEFDVNMTDAQIINIILGSNHNLRTVSSAEIWRMREILKNNMRAQYGDSLRYIRECDEPLAYKNEMICDIIADFLQSEHCMILALIMLSFKNSLEMARIAKKKNDEYDLKFYGIGGQQNVYANIVNVQK